MTTLTKIEAAAEALPVAQQQALLLFLTERLREQGPAMPPGRAFSAEQITEWIAEDEADAMPGVGG